MSVTFEGRPIRSGMDDNRGLLGASPVEKPASPSAVIAPSSSEGSTSGKSAEGKPQQVFVAPPGHGSGCGHCVGQGKWVKPEEAAAAKQADRKQVYDEVMKHEMAHQSAGGHLAGGITVRQHSDGSADGEVPVAIPKVNPKRPDDALRDGQIVVNAAMAPDKPSGQDYRVAAQGRALMAEASAAKNSQPKPDSVGSPKPGSGGETSPSVARAKPAAGAARNPFASESPFAV